MTLELNDEEIESLKRQFTVKCLECDNTSTVYNTPEQIRKSYTCYYCGCKFFKIFRFNENTNIWDIEVKEV